MNLNNRRLVLVSLFTALIAAGAVFSLPLPPPLPPVTLAVFFALLAGLIIGPVWGVAAVGLYLFLGAIGLPLFANGSGGLGYFAGPTGGFLVGYLGATFASGLVADRKHWKFSRAVIASVVGVSVLYALGLPWFRAVVDARPGQTMTITAAFLIMLPYLAGDLLKAVAAASLVRALKPLLVNYLPSPTRTVPPTNPVGIPPAGSEV